VAQRPGVLHHFGDPIISRFNGKIKAVVAASSKLPPHDELALSKRDNLPLSKFQCLPFRFDVFQPDHPVFFQRLIEKPILELTLQPDLSVGCPLNLPFYEV